MIDVSNDGHVAKGDIRSCANHSRLRTSPHRIFAGLSIKARISSTVKLERVKVSIMLNEHRAKLMKPGSIVLHLLDHFGGRIPVFGLRGGVVAGKVEVAVANSRQMLEATEGSLQ